LSRRSLVRRVAFSAVVVIACAHAPSPASRGEHRGSGSVELRFAWPADFQSQVYIAHDARRGGAEPTALVARERMVAERKGNELRVSTRDVAARGSEPELQEFVDMSEALVQV
jgi:hypothetical protein